MIQVKPPPSCRATADAASVLAVSLAMQKLNLRNLCEEAREPSQLAD